MLQTWTGRTLDKVLFEVVEGTLDLTLGPGVTYAASHRLHAVVPAKLQKTRVPLKVSRFSAKHKGPSIVYYQLFGCPTEFPQPVFYPLKD